MKDTPLGSTSTVEELHKLTKYVSNQEEFAEDAVDTSGFPVFIRVITRPRIIRTVGDVIEVVAEAETQTYCLESEDIEIFENAVWLVVAQNPTAEEAMLDQG